MEYDVAPEDRERSINCSQQKFYKAFQQHQHNSALLGQNMKTATTPSSITEITAFQPIQYATNSTSKVTTATPTVINHSMSTAATTTAEQKYNSSIIMEAATTHINLIDDEEEKDPLALDSTLEQQSQLQDHITVKHTHSLRRHVPRIIVKPIPPEKKTPTTATATTAAAVMTTTTITSHSSISPSSRTSSSRRIQQQQQAKAAAAAAAAAAALANSTSLSTTATTFSTTAITQASTMREVLASIPGFSLKPRRRSSKKISTAAQIEQTKDGKIDLETPDSILASTNLRALLNKQTFSMLPPLYQYNLIQLLPSVDREAIEMERNQTNATTMPIEAIRLGTSNLNNEFFARACLEWRERLSEGEFTPENQVKLKTEAEREKNKLDPWKLKHFEPIWGEKAANRACSSNSSISSNKSSIDTCNIAITNSSSSGSGSGSGSGSCKSLGEQKLEFKLESKGALTATIVNATSNALNIKESPSLEIKQETKSIIECRLDHHQKATEVLEVARPTTLPKQETDKIENSASGVEEYVCKVEEISTHLQQRNDDDLKCDKQTEMYEKIDAVDKGCLVNSEGVETPIKREPPSVFDLLRMQGNLYEHEAKQQKRGVKRSSDNISANALVSVGGTGIESDNNKQQIQQQDEEISDSYNMESKQLKIEITKQNVPKQSKSNFVNCAVSSDAPTTTKTINFQNAASSTAELEVAEEVVGEETTSCNAIVPMQNAASFTQEILDSYAAVEQQLHLHFLQKQEQLKVTAQHITTESELESTATPTTKLQYFAQIQPTTTNQNIINNINSTCDSMKDAFNAVETIAAVSSNQTIELQQIVAAVNESPSGGEAVDLIEQNFADAENYVLQSGDASTDSGDTLNVQNSTSISAATTGNKNNLNEGDFIFSSSLDHVIGSDECDNLYDNNKAMLPTSISSATTSSSSSSSSSSTSSSPTTSSAVTTSDMQEIISAANSMSNTLFQAPQQLQQQQQHQQQRQHQEEQQQPAACSIMSSSTSRHNEMFQHVQHDWNFGGLKLHQNNEKYLNTNQDQSTASQQQQQHILQPTVEVQEDDDINDDNDDDVDECVLSHTINNDVAQHIIEDEPEDDDDEMDDSDAVRDIVDELQQQHQQLLQEQQQEHLHQQLQVQEQQRQEQQQQFPTEQLEYSNEMSESLSSDVLCEVPMSAAEMEVTSTVVTNSNSNDDSSNELNLFNSSTANISNPAINHIQHMPSQPPQTQQQRQILVDSNGQIIRNFLMQQQQLQQQQQLLQHAQQFAAFQTNQHHPAAVAVPQPPPQQQAQQQLIQHTQSQSQQQQQHQPQKTATLSMQVIRRQYDNGTNGQQQLFQHAVAAQAPPQQQQQHSIEQSNHHQIQHFALQQQHQQQQQQRNFLPQTTNAVSQQASTSNNLMPSQQMQLQPTQHQQQQHHHHHHQQQHQHQHQQMPTFQTQAQQPPKFISKQLNIISMPRSSVNITSSSAATPSAVTAYSYNTSPAISAALPIAATAAANSLITAQQQQQQQHAASAAINTIKTLPSTPVGIPSTIAQQRLIMTKLPSGKGRKATNNKLPPGAVNLERSYQICQAVIQNSPNRESLKAQLRPPSAILGQQQSSGGSSPSSTSLSNSCSSASSSPSSSAVHVKSEDIIASSTTLPTGMPPNVMGVGRPNVYKVIGPRMGFPRKKYVQRQPSPTMIRHVYAAPPGAVNMSTANTQQLNVLQQQQQQHHPHHHPHIQLQAPPPQHELHQNGSGQYVLVHRANVGAADNQAPRASSAPPVPQNQHQFHGMNGIPITGRGRPASVDVDTSNTVHEIQQTIHGANPANIVRRNISAGNITYIDNYSATAPAALVDGSNYIVTTAAAAAAAQSTDNSGENTPPTTDSNNCACSLNAMVICQQCGAFCHDDCISATRLCVSCVIR